MLAGLNKKLVTTTTDSTIFNNIFSIPGKRRRHSVLMMMTKSSLVSRQLNSCRYNCNRYYYEPPPGSFINKNCFYRFSRGMQQHHKQYQLVSLSKCFFGGVTCINNYFTTTSQVSSNFGKQSISRKNPSYCYNSNNNYYFSSTSTAVTSYDPTNDPSLLTVSIVGPPNAGKSTLFNRLLCKESNKSYRLSSDKNNKYKSNNTKRKGRVADKLLSSIGGTGGTAIVSPIAGTTRDRRECIGRIGSVYFRLYDTAGINTDMGNVIYKNKKNNITKKRNIVDSNDNNNTIPITNSAGSSNVHAQMMNQTMEAARASDLVLLVFDARNAGITSDLLETTKWLRKVMKYGSTSSNTTTDTHTNHHQNHKRVVVCANKLEGSVLEESWSENVDEATYRLGFGNPILLSALHGEGIADIAVTIEETMQIKRQQQRQSLLKRDDLSNDSSRVQQVDDPTVPLIEEHQHQEIYYQEGVDENKQEKPLQLAIVGRPNVGKSTLVNSLIQSDRVLTGSTPGLTRDAITIPWMWKTTKRNDKGTRIPWNRPMQIVDTAGIRKPSLRREAKIRTNEFMDDDEEGGIQSNFITIDDNNKKNSSSTSSQTNEELALLEEMAVADAMRALKVADVVVLVLDAQAGFLHKHELAICNSVLQEGRSLVIAANKMDLLIRHKTNNTDEEYTKADYANQVRDQLESRFPILRKTPIVPMSSLTGDGVSDLLPVVFYARDRWERTISTGQLNRWLNDAVLSRHAPPPNSQHRPVRIKYVVQTKGRPPTFLLFCSGGGKTNNNNNIKSILPESYLRYLVRHFQDTFNMYGMEIRFAIKNSNRKGNPFDSKNSGSSTTGIGGRQARKQRFIKALKTTGTPPSRRRKRRRTSSNVHRYR